MKRYHRYGITFAAFLLTTALIILVCRFSYVSYQNELIAKEEDQLLTMARTVGKNLNIFIEQELDEIDLYYEDQEQKYSDGSDVKISDIVDQLVVRKPQLYLVAECYDENGILIWYSGPEEGVNLPDYNNKNLPDDKKKLLQNGKTFILGKTLNQEPQYLMNVARLFTIGIRQYMVVYSLNLNEVYKQIVEPVHIGVGGYSVVKDEDLKIIMHHAPSQIGMDAFYDRKTQYSELDLSDLEEWIHVQETQPEGTAVIRSYQWDVAELTPEKRIVAYTTIALPGEHWIVNSTLPYKELDLPLQRMIARLLGLGSVFVLLYLVLEFLVVRGIMRAHNQKKEIEYLKEINSGMELLRRKDEEIQHYQRVHSIGQMSSHIAHEFNNYLTPIMVYGELLETDPDITESQKEMVSEIVNVAEQAAGLSRRLLDFSRQDSSIVLEPVNLTEEMKRACSVIRQLTPARVRYFAEIPDKDCMVIGRKGMVEHLLMNLSNNAFHAMEKNGDREACLTISMIPEPTEKDQELYSGYVCIQVADTGCGIKADALNHIFEPFYTTKRSGKGTGLGLSVVHNLVTTCGGTIRVDSQEGVGTTFSLYFPISDQAEKDQASVIIDDVDTCTDAKCVMVIDDDPQILKALEVLYAHEGLRVICFEHPAAALAQIQNNNECCDILLTDYDMPSINGVELAEIVRKLNPKIQIILMSGLDEGQFTWHLKNRIIDQFVAKEDLFDKAVLMAKR